MQHIIFNYEYDYNKILIWECSDNIDFKGSYYKIDLCGLYKPTLFKMFKDISYDKFKIFDFNISINNEYSSYVGSPHGPSTIFNYDIFSYFSAEKFYRRIEHHHYNGIYGDDVLNFWKNYEMEKFIDGWKKYGYQEEYVKKIEDIYNGIIIKSIIE